MLNSSSPTGEAIEDIGLTEVLTTHPTPEQLAVKTFPPVDVQAVNRRRAYAVAGGLVGRGFIVADANSPTHDLDWRALITAIQEELNSLAWCE